MIDPIDAKILELLRTNSRMQWKEIGQIIHMTGQAVGNRIRKLEEEGIIKAYTIMIDHMKTNGSYISFITVFMKTNEHSRFLTFLTTNDHILEAHRISGEGCYILKVIINTQDHLDGFLNEILKFGNYRLNLSVKQIK